MTTSIRPLPSLPAMIAKRARKEPERPFIHDATAGCDYSFGEVHSRSLQWAGALKGLGLAPRARVAVMLPNGIDPIALWFGIAWAGFIEVPVNPAYKGPILEHMLSDCGASALVTTSTLLPVVDPITTRLPKLQTILQADGTVAHGVPRGVRLLNRDEIDACSPIRAPDELPQSWDPMGILYTSGTTGPAKGVVAPWGMLVAGLGVHQDLGPNDAWYSPFPLSHGIGKGAVSQMAYGGGRVVIRDTLSVTSFWEDIDRHGCTFTLVIPAVAQWLMKTPPSAADKQHALKHVQLSPIVPGFAERFGVTLRTAYGMTELSPPFARYNITDRFASVGKPRPGFEVRLVDQHDIEVPPGEVGEMIVRHDRPWSLMTAYWNRPEETAGAMRNGWLHTGDAFRCDEEGCFYFVDRMKDALRRRGENISSFEVEQCVLSHPAVNACAAFGITIDQGEQELMIAVTLKPDAQLGHAALHAHLTEVLPRHMVPRFIEFAATLPRTEATLRIQKHVLRERGIGPQTWDAEKGGLAGEIAS